MAIVSWNLELEFIMEDREPEHSDSSSDEDLRKRVEEHELEATELYSQTVAETRHVYGVLQEPGENQVLEVPYDILDRVVSMLQSGNQELLALADRSAPDNYLFAHVTNVTIFSAHLGLSLDLSQEDMRALSVCAFLHDIGMVVYLPLISMPIRLSSEEMKQVRQYTEDGQKLLTLFTNLDKDLRGTAEGVLGHAQTLSKNPQFSEKALPAKTRQFASIVGLCNLYESLTHPRSWRERFLPHHALLTLTDEYEKEFEQGLVKKFFEAMTLYPTGSFVRLNTGEIAKVIFTNPAVPTRPKIKVLVDAKCKRMSQPKLFDLTTHPVSYIAEAVDETKVQTDDKLLLMELRAQRWWVKGL